jgi:hypothetical protein
MGRCPGTLLQKLASAAQSLPPSAMSAHITYYLLSIGYWPYLPAWWQAVPQTAPTSTLLTTPTADTTLCFSATFAAPHPVERMQARAALLVDDVCRP